MKNSFFLAVVFTALLACGWAAPVVNTVAPLRAGHGGGVDIVVSGCGFRTYATVLCLFGGKYPAFASEIQSDTTIICTTPYFDPEVYDLPFQTNLELIFDGQTTNLFIATGSFVFGPSFQSISPSSGYTSGGALLTITGSGFDEFDNVTVLFEGVNQCTNAAVGDYGTAITCNVPAGVFNQDAVIDVIFDNIKCLKFRLPFTYHYGPVFTSTVPSCANIVGGTKVSISGLYFDDPAIAASVNVANAVARVEFVPRGGNTRYNATGVSLDTTNGVLTVTAPAITNTNIFGSFVDINVYWKLVDSKVTEGSQVTAGYVRYGPIVSTTQNLFTSHRNGGDNITIAGCGFSFYTISQLHPQVILSGNVTREVCNRGSAPGSATDTLVIIPGATPDTDVITCVTQRIECNPPPNSLGYPFNLFIQPTGYSSPLLSNYTTPSPTSLVFLSGPSVTSITPNNGNFLGGEVITATGSNFFLSALNSAANPGWNAQFDFRDTAGTFSRTVSATFVSDNTLTAVVPAGLFGVRANVQVDFNPRTGADSSCHSIPRSSPFNYFFGPTCTSFPANDWLSGQREVELAGAELISGGVPEVRVCINRLQPAAPGCSVYEKISTTSSSYSASQTSITFSTPSIRQNVNRPVGGNRLFGDAATIWLYYTNITANQVYPGLSTYPTAAIQCGNYRFGPDVDDITPCRGPDGPRAPNSPGLTATITGTAFNDPIYNTNTLVAFGTVNSINAQVDSDSDITAATRWGGPVNTAVGVTAIFNTCNTTTTTSVLKWGPSISNITAIGSRAPVYSSFNPNGDIWGVLPQGGQTVTVTGTGFSEFSGSISCQIDGELVTTVAGGAPNTIVCTTPAREYGTTGKVSLLFGTITGSGGEPNWKQTLTYSQVLHYEARIDDVQPRFGLTSGNTPVVISGEGFSGWNTTECLFGGYLGSTATVDGGGLTVSCSTPNNRGEFNTDVLVAVQLNNPLAGSTSWHMHAVAPYTFHYGPVCQDINPWYGPISGSNAVTILGQGFQDCQVSDTAPFRDCTFRNIQVFFVDPDTGESFQVPLVSNDTLASPNTATSYSISSVVNASCMANRIVQIYYQDAVVGDESQRYVTCPITVPGHTINAFYHYGPLFYNQSSTYYRNGVSYGWAGDVVTITGVNFDDDSLASPVRCRFGNLNSTLASFSSTTVTCFAPAGEFNQVVQIWVEWGQNSTDPNTCTLEGGNALAAGYFHYGPVIDSLVPTRGFVNDSVTVTISGFAFQCCQISTYTCGFPFNLTSVGALSSDSVTCALPPNPIGVDLRLNNLGITFGSPLFTNFSSIFLTESGSVLTYQYGPSLTSISQTRFSLIGGTPFSFNGSRWNDPYFDTTNAWCDFFTQTGGLSQSNLTNCSPGASACTPATVSADGSTITCTTPQWIRRCGDIDLVRPRVARVGAQFLRQDQGSYYWKTIESPPPPVVFTYPYPSDGGSNVAVEFAISYGARVDSVTAVGGLNSPLAGGLSVTLTGDFSDWVDPAGKGNYGTQLALCVFGGRSSPLTPTTSNGDVTTAVITNTQVVCTTPPGGFAETGVVSVILDPHFDASTQLLPRDGTGWRWMPFATGLSRNWGHTGGYETTVVSGEGFSAYANVICLFDDVEAVESDIIDDFFVSCLTPPHLPAETTVSLLFCNPSAGNCACTTCRSPRVNSNFIPGQLIDDCLEQPNNDPATCYSQCVSFGFSLSDCADGLPNETRLLGTFTTSFAQSDTTNPALVSAFASAAGLPTYAVYVFKPAGTSSSTFGGVLFVETATVDTVDIRNNVQNNLAVLTAAGITSFAFSNTVALNPPSNTGNIGKFVQDHAIVPETFTYVGILSFDPPSGPTCGNTDVTVTGLGFSNFVSIGCVFGGHDADTTVVSDTKVVCNTPDINPGLELTNPVDCAAVELNTFDGQGNNVILRAPDQFVFGVPRAVSITPRKASVEFSRFVNITGLYFNGGSPFSEYSCKFGSYPAVPASIQRSLVQNTLSFIICETPNLYQSRFKNLRVGVVGVEVGFDCEIQTQVLDRVPFNFTQYPDPRSFGPSEGSELGGTIVTVFGKHFVGGSGYFCGFGDVFDHDDDGTSQDDDDESVVSATLDRTYSPPAIVCTTPNLKKAQGDSVDVTFSISIDGGNVFHPVGNFTYYTVNPRPRCDKPISSGSVLAPGLLLLAVLASFLLFML